MSDLTRTGGSMSRHEPGAAAHRRADEASDLLKRLFRSFDGSLALRLWNGTTLRLGNAAPHASDPSFTLVCHHPGVVRSMLLGRDPLRLAEAYFQGDIDVEGDFFAALCLKDHMHSIRLSLRDRLGALLTALRLPAPGEARPDSQSPRSTLHGRAVSYPVRNGLWLWEGLSQTTWQQQHGLPGRTFDYNLREQVHMLHTQGQAQGRAQCADCHLGGTEGAALKRYLREACAQCHNLQPAFAAALTRMAETQPLQTGQARCVSCHAQHGAEKDLRASVRK